MSTDQFISLDWRQSPPRTVIIERITKLLAGVDEWHEGRLTLSQSNARDLAQDRYSQQPAVLLLALRPRQDFRVDAEPEPAAQGSPKYSMSLDRARRLMLDLALTINVHPSALGIMGEDGGQVSVPKLVSIELTRVTNAIAYNDRDKNPSQDFKRVAKLTPGIYKIPDLVLSLKVATRKHGKVGGKIDAIVVAEHRNLSEVLLREKLAVEDVIVVLTAGFPDSATKEFLHLLSTAKKTKDLLFLYLGDHDPAGYSIFQCLKYGSRMSAWATPISVCPQLRYVGPTLEDLKESAKLFRTTWEKQYRADHVRATDAEVNRAADKWQAIAEKNIEDKLTNLIKKDKETLRSFDRLGWLVHEDLIHQEIKAMKQGKGVFRFANLAQVGVPYVRRFVEVKVREACPQHLTASQPAVISGSPATRDFRAASSQSQSQGINQPSTAVPQSNVASNSQADVAVPLDTNRDIQELAEKAIF
ncbi:MAG: hypothetical protein Q9179_003817 [Wetmoreana sp. 5 TL-2023]